MKSVNRITLLGNVGNDPEVRTTTGGARVGTLSLATTETWKDGNERHEKTQWHRLVVWQGLAEIVEKYVKKGSRLFVEGPVEYRTWQDKDGVTRYTTEVIVRELTLLGEAGGKRNDGGQRGGAPDEFPDDLNETAGEFFDRQAAAREATPARTPPKKTATAKTGTRRR